MLIKMKIKKIFQVIPQNYKEIGISMMMWKTNKILIVKIIDIIIMILRMVLNRTVAMIIKIIKIKKIVNTSKTNPLDNWINNNSTQIT